MRIALVAPLAEAVPPKLYGGTERVVSLLAEELARLGHRVTLFASNGSETAAELVVCAPQSLRPRGSSRPSRQYTSHAARGPSPRRSFRHHPFSCRSVAAALSMILRDKCLVTLHGRLESRPIPCRSTEPIRRCRSFLSQTRNAGLCRRTPIGSLLFRMVSVRMFAHSTRMAALTWLSLDVSRRRSVRTAQ